MKYKGFIYSGVKHLQRAGINTREPHYFKIVGFWLYKKHEKKAIYRMVNEKGEPIKGTSKLLFSRTRDNEFFLESMY